MHCVRFRIAAAWLLLAACGSEEANTADPQPSGPAAGTASVSQAGKPAAPSGGAGNAAPASAQPAPSNSPSAASGSAAPARPMQPMAAGANAPMTPVTPAAPMTTPTADGVVFPGANWETKTPADAGFDAAKLDAAAASLLMSLPGRQCFAVFRNGYLVYEKYYTGDAHTKNTGYSTSKSFGSTLVGIAVTQGLLKTDDLVKTLLPDSTVGADIQIKHLLTMTGHVQPPGMMFDYAMGQMLLGNLANAIANKSGMTIGQFFDKNLKAPLEFQDIDWGGGRYISFAGNVSTTCRDGARLGHLWANKGSWKGQKLISDAYYDEATMAAFPMANAGYGYNFWLNVANSRTKRVSKSFAAIGANAQYIIVVPELQLVITSYGNDPSDRMMGGPSIGGLVLEAML